MKTIITALTLTAIFFFLPGQKSMAQGTEGGNKDTIIIDHDAIQRQVEAAMKEVEKAMEQMQRDLEKAQRDLEQAQRNMPNSGVDEGGNENTQDTTIRKKNATFKISDDGICVKLGGNADKDSEKGDEKKKEKQRENIETDWFLMDLGINTIYSNGNIEVPAGAEFLELNYGGSRNFTLHLFQQGVNISNHKIFFRYGVSFDFLNYRFQDNITLIPNSSRPDSLAVSTGENFSRNKLAAQYITIPMMFQVETNPFERGKSFRWAAGGYAGLLINSYTKQKTEDGRKVKVQDDFNLNKIRYGLRGEVGFSNITLFANYDMSPLFRTAVYPEMTNLTFGLVLNGFTWD